MRWQGQFSWDSVSENSTPIILLSRIFANGLEEAGVSVHILVATAREIEDDKVVFGQFRQALHETGNGMRRFQRGNNPLRARKQPRGIQGGLIGNGRVLRAALVRQPCMLGTDSRIVEPRGNGMRRGDLPIFVLQNVSVRSLKDSWPRAHKPLMSSQTSRMLAKLPPPPSRFDPNHFHLRITQKLMEQPDGVGPASDTSEKMRGQTLFRSEDLLARFAADDRLKITHHCGIGMRARTEPRR